MTPGAAADLSASFGSTPDLAGDYSQSSRDRIEAHRLPADQSLVDYVLDTAGKHGATPWVAGP